MKRGWKSQDRCERLHSVEKEHPAGLVLGAVTHSSAFSSANGGIREYQYLFLLTLWLTVKAKLHNACPLLLSTAKLDPDDC